MNETDFKTLLRHKLHPIFKKRVNFTFGSYNAIIPITSKYDLYFVNLISACSEIFKLDSLNINNMYDLIKEANPIIYYLRSWVENHVERSTIFHGLVNNIIDFKIKFHFYEDISEEKYQFGPDGIIDFNFEFKNLKKDEDVLTEIKSCISEELKNSSDITFPTNLVKIMIIYEIKHTY